MEGNFDIKTKKQIVDEMLGIGVSFNSEGMDIKLAQDVADAARELSEKYPCVGKKLKMISTLEGNPPRMTYCEKTAKRTIKDVGDLQDDNCMSICHQNGGEGVGLAHFGIVLNPHNWKKYDDTMESLAYMEETGNAPSGCGNVRGLIAHDYGHAMYTHCIRGAGVFKRALLKTQLHLLIIYTAFKKPMLTRRLSCKTDAFAEGFIALNYGDETSKNHPLTKWVGKVVRKYEKK